MSAVGYNSLTNNLAQTVATNGVINLGHIVAASCAQNVSTLDGTSLVVNNTGVYNIQFDVVGTPTVSSTLQLQININNVSRAAISMVTGANADTDTFTVRGIFYMNKGDIITITNTGGAFTIPAVTVLNGYNVSTIIERYN